MNARERKKLERELFKALEREGLVFRGLTDYEAQRRAAIRQLRARIRKYDRATTAFFNSHFNKQTRAWDSKQATEFFGKIRKNRTNMYGNLKTLNGEESVSAEWDSP
jgi:hypothetical protein